MSVRQEWQLSAPVRAWMERQGWTVYVEQFDCDLVGVRNGQLFAVELKLCFTRGLMDQCDVRATWADFVACAVISEPRLIGYARSRGYGVLTVAENDKVHQKVKAQPQPWGWEKRHAYRLKKLAGQKPSPAEALGGLPSGKKWREAALAAAAQLATGASQ